MSDESEAQGSFEPPDVSLWLLSYLDVRRGEYEEQYADATNDEELHFHRALAEFERKAEDLVTTGILPQGLAESLLEFMPGDPIEAKVRELLTYRIVHHRLEFDIAADVCSRLSGVDKRVQIVVIFTMLLLGYRPSPTAVKYFQRATRLYLAGYEAEAVIMCGAVLEAALAHRFPDELLQREGMRPAFRRTGDFSAGQRLHYEEMHRVLTPEQRKAAGQLMNWRNDAIHVQPDVGPDAKSALVNLVLVLPVLLASRGSSTAE